MEVVYRNMFLLVVKDSTGKQTQKQMKGSRVGMGSTSSGGPFNYFLVSIPVLTLPTNKKISIYIASVLL